MLTFSFTGVEGTMTESEILTSGMVGKEVLLVFDDSWANLTKTVVFRAGDTTRVVMDPGETIVIPAEVLERPFVRLYAGVYGTDESGALVIPTVMAEGPMIRWGADPVEDETARELPVWVALQAQINDLSDQLSRLTQGSGGLSAEAAQLLVDILSKGLYSSDQTAQIETLAELLGTAVSEDLSHLIHYWDFRSGNLTDRIGGLEAVTSDDVSVDSKGAHLPGNNSYIMFPEGADGATLAGCTVEVKFGELSLDESASTHRLMLICAGTQPAALGLQWTVQDCWSSKSSLVTEFNDLNMFSGKSLIMKANEDASVLEWYVDGQLIVSYTPTISHTHLSIGSTTSGAFPLTVEYIRIYPNT